MPFESAANDSTRKTPPSMEGGNAYFRSLSVQNVRCFGATQQLNLEASDGAPARWTLLLGDNGVGKTTLLQVLALGAAQKTVLPTIDGQDFHAVLPRLAEPFWPPKLQRADQIAGRVGYRVLWAHSLDQGENGSPDGAELSWRHEGPSIQVFGQNSSSIIYGYGANRRRAPNGLTAEASSDPTETLFEDDATLRNPEEWLLQNELVANTPSPLQDRAQLQKAGVREILTRILPGIDDVRVNFRTTGNQQVRASAEVHGPDGWIPLSALGLGYRTMTAWIVDLSSRLFERYGALANPLSGAAVCLVDEIDLHLHPRWQRDLITRLTALFPNTQFIATAHSPLVVQAAPDANVVVLKREGDSVIIDNAPRSVRKWRVDQILTSELFEALGLRRPELNADRERHLSHVSMLHMVAAHPDVPADLRTRARTSLAKLTAPEAEYSLMCQVAVEALGGPPT